MNQHAIFEESERKKDGFKLKLEGNASKKKKHHRRDLNPQSQP